MTFQLCNQSIKYGKHIVRTLPNAHIYHIINDILYIQMCEFHEYMDKVFPLYTRTKKYKL